VTTAATVTGMGTDNMIQVPANRTTSQMDPIALNDCIQVEIKKGNRPFFVNAVAGSTVMGSFDDLKAIGEICKQYGLWFHVDACWGGFLIFASSEYQTDRFRGVELADSISFNPHKGLGVPQQCSMLITHKKKEALRQSNGSNAEYLFQPQNSGYDIGNKTLGCGRKADALKLWLTIRKRGLDGFRKMADNELKKAARMKQLVDESDDFEMVANPMGTNVCFWYTPKYFRQHAEKYTNSCKAEVHKLIFNRMKDHGNCLIQQNPLTEFDLPNFFRLALGADRSRLHDMDYLLEEIRRLGQDITCSDIDTKFL
jgi:glutamate/tyrosine decarboxylase-like PLP-dependent enzyme